MQNWLPYYALLLILTHFMCVDSTGRVLRPWLLPVPSVVLLFILSTRHLE